MLLLDDLQNVEERSRSLFGIQITVRRSVEEVLEYDFKISNLETAKWQSFRHNFDFVLLDYELEEDQIQTDNPLGGMSLFPIFVESFTGFGDCVVANYSDKLRDKRLATMCRLFEIGQCIRHRRDIERIRQVSFQDFNLVPLIKYRAMSILLNMPCHGVLEMIDTIAKLGPEKGLDVELSSLRPVFKAPITLGNLRPDIGRPAFTRGVKCGDSSMRKIGGEEITDFVRWLGDLQRHSSACERLFRLWNVPRVNEFVHVEGAPFPPDFWQKTIHQTKQGSFYFLYNDEERRKPYRIDLPRRVATDLRAMQWGETGVSRCDTAHRYFRMSVKNVRGGDSQHYREGYLLSDIEQETRLCFREHCSFQGGNTLYLYVPLPILRDLLVRLAGELKVDMLTVEIPEDGQYIQFSAVSKTPIRIADAQAISEKTQANTWGPVPLIREWGDLLLTDENGLPWCIGAGGVVGTNWEGWEQTRNSFSLRFVLHSVIRGGG
jgi:hypothetical protein